MLRGCDRVVLLGDIFELRQARAEEVLAAARPLFADLADALGSGQVVFVPGNHDHRLAQPVFDRLQDSSSRLGLALQARVEPGQLLEPLAKALDRTELVISYPGFWVREDIYATHGHYLDCHSEIPGLESLVASACARLLAGGLAGPRLGPSDYERALAPVYALADRAAQAAAPVQGIAGSSYSARIFQGLSLRQPPALDRGRALVLQTLAAANRLGLAHFAAMTSSKQLTDAGLRAMALVVQRLGIAASHVIFGHTHAAGPLDAEPEFVLSDGTQLVNTGSWVYEPVLFRGLDRQSRYWPGVVTTVADSGPPRQLHALDGLSGSDLERAGGG